MIKGIGVDIVEISRIEKAILKHKNFINKIYDEEEILYLEEKKFNAETAAGIFAAKEAVSKALGTGFRGFGPKDIVIVRNDLFKPEVILKGGALLLLAEYENYIFNISISHSNSDAIAFAVLEVFI